MNLLDRLFKSSDALLEKGTQYLWGLGDKPVDIPLAYEYFTLAAEKGNKFAEGALESYFMPGRAELNEKIRDGFETLRKLRLDVEAGEPSACFVYGVGKLSDDVDDTVYQKGIAKIKLAAEKGFAPAMFVYGCELIKGIISGVRRVSPSEV